MYKYVQRHLDPHIHIHIQANQSCHTCEWLKSNSQKSHVTRTNEVCHICNHLLARLRTSRVTRFLFESTNILLRLRRSNEVHHIKHANESCHICEQLRTRFPFKGTNILYDYDVVIKFVMAHAQMSYVAFVNTSCHAYEQDFYSNAPTFCNDYGAVTKWTTSRLRLLL